MAVCYMCIGLPGSGKSSWATKSGLPVVSTDSIREELYGNVNDQRHNQQVFNEAFNRVKEYAIKDQDCVFDATNILVRRRRPFVQNFKCIGVVMATPIEVCKERNNKRERVVPEHVIERMWKSFQAPMEEEGFVDIVVVRPPDSDLKDKAVAAMRDFDQQNHHHSLPLGAHCNSSEAYLKSIGCDHLCRAARFHDVGKLWTKSIGEDGEAHYYSHACVGAYWALCAGLNVYEAALIGHHMDFYNPQFRLPSWWSEQFVEDLQKIHDADLATH